MPDRANTAPVHRGWLERVSQALLGEPQDREQLVELLRNAHQRELLDIDALGMIEGVFQVAEMQVRDIMIPRAQMVVVDEDADLRQMLPVAIDSAHSRFPVIGENRDEVLGILLAKDLLRYLTPEDAEPFELHDILRPAVVVPESKRLNVLLKEFRDSRNHMAIVVDEYGGVAGLVTIEDVLEQIVGDITDEHDVAEEAHIFAHTDTRYSVKALTPIEEFNDYFHTHHSDAQYDTIGGLVLSQFGHLPRRGEDIVLDGLHFEVARADTRRIHLLHVQVLEGASAASEAGASEDVRAR